MEQFDFTVQDMTGLLKVLQESDFEPATIYRGVKDERFKLIPKIGRICLNKQCQGNCTNVDRMRDSIEECEKKIFNKFKKQARPYVNLKVSYNNHNPGELWEWIALAQHYGLPTRLLDWSDNPLVAAFFAVNEIKTTNDESNGSLIYVYNLPYKYRPEDSELEEKSPFDLGIELNGMIITPYHVSNRIISQAGLFTIHSDPLISLEPSENRFIKTIFIPNSSRERIKYDLNEYGINRASLFPDLDGISDFITWHFKHYS